MALPGEVRYVNATSSCRHLAILARSVGVAQVVSMPSIHPDDACSKFMICIQAASNNLPADACRDAVGRFTIQLLAGRSATIRKVTFSLH